jgi:hypothetical protein
MDQHGRDVCFVPEADILRCSEERLYSICGYGDLLRSVRHWIEKLIAA